jgi:hypothetical protein
MREIGDALPRLARCRSAPCLSVFFHRTGQPGDRAAFEALVLLAERELSAFHQNAAAPDLLQPLWRLAGSDAFIRDEARDVALFIAPGVLMQVAIGYPVRDAVEIGHRFQIRPLLRRVAPAEVVALRRDPRLAVVRDLGAILRAAEAGEVATILIARQARAWGAFDHGVAVTRTIAESDDEDLLDLAALAVVAHGGIALDVDGGAIEPGTPAIAILRSLVDHHHQPLPMAAATLKEPT